jgi:hypothetical protein
VCSRRRFHNRFVTLLAILGIFLIILFLLPSNPRIFTIARKQENGSRLFCVLVLTDPAHTRFYYMSNVTWARHCHSIGIVRYRRLPRPDDGKLTRSKENFQMICVKL